MWKYLIVAEKLTSDQNSVNWTTQSSLSVPKHAMPSGSVPAFKSLNAYDCMHRGYFSADHDLTQASKVQPRAFDAVGPKTPFPSAV